MTTNHSDQGFISNRGASDRLFPAHLLTSFIHHRMLGSNKPEDDVVTRVKTIPLKSWHKSRDPHQVGMALRVTDARSGAPKRRKEADLPGMV